MTLSYKNLNDESRQEIKAVITDGHPASSYGRPVIAIEYGDAIDALSWSALDYKIEKISDNELVLMKRYFPHLLQISA